MSITHFGQPPRIQIDPAGGALLASVDIPTHMERVFTALTNPADIVAWWGSSDTYLLLSWSGDVCIGGAWKAVGRRIDGTTFTIEGLYLEVEAPYLLITTWTSSQDEGEDTTVTYQLEEIAEGTRLTVRHDGFRDREQTCRHHAQGWELILGWLANHLRSPDSRI